MQIQIEKMKNEANMESFADVCKSQQILHGAEEEAE